MTIKIIQVREKNMNSEKKNIIISDRKCKMRNRAHKLRHKPGHKMFIIHRPSHRPSWQAQFACCCRL